MKERKNLTVLLAIALSFCLTACGEHHHWPTTTTTTTTTPNNSYQGMVSVTFDDGSRLSGKVLKAIDDNWISATFYIVTSWTGDGTHFTWDELREMYANGHEIGTHTASHKHLLCSEAPSNCYAEGEYLSDLEKAKEEFLAQGLIEVNALAYPYGEFDEKTIAMLKGTGFIASARQAYVDGDTFNTKANLNSYKLCAFSVRKSNLAQIPALIDQAIAQDVWLILVFHTISESPVPADDEDISEAAFSEIMQFISSTNIYSVKVSDGLEQMLPR